MPPRIRPATNSDVPEIVAVIKSVYDEYGFTWEAERYHADLYDIEKFYAPPDNFWVGVDEGDKAIGTVALEIFDRIPGNEGEIIEHDGYRRCAAADCSLERLYVAPAARGTGLGTALTKHVIEEAQSAGRTLMEFWSDKRFVAAHRLYGRLGARVIGDRICDDPDESPEWGLILSL